jgi:hypothetical protein
MRLKKEKLVNDVWNRYRHFILLVPIWDMSNLVLLLSNELYGLNISCIHVIDSYIPFIGVFVLPYLFWFAYMAIGFLYLGHGIKKGLL